MNCGQINVVLFNLILFGVIYSFTNYLRNTVQQHFFILFLPFYCSLCIILTFIYNIYFKRVIQLCRSDFWFSSTDVLWCWKLILLPVIVQQEHLCKLIKPVSFFCRGIPSESCAEQSHVAARHPVHRSGGVSVGLEGTCGGVLCWAFNISAFSISILIGIFLFPFVMQMKSRRNAPQTERSPEEGPALFSGEEANIPPLDVEISEK